MSDNLEKMGKSIEIDKNLCIGCTKCSKACEEIGISYLKMVPQENKRNKVASRKDEGLMCIWCGQCTAVCPVDAIREQREIEDVKKILNDKTKIKIVQSAPSIRSSICEAFKLGNGINAEKKLNTLYRKLGFDKVFDVNFGADITTVAEAAELTERLKEETEYGIGKKLPMFTACCPAWVSFVEQYVPELIPNLTTARSPHIHSGIAYKTWWAEKEGINPKDIVVVSIMPCTAKKSEAKDERLNVNGLYPVDYVLTTRELAKLTKEREIDFATLEDSEMDPYGEYSGAAAIYGASGGVMESALRTAYKDITGNDLPKLDLIDVRTDLGGYKRAEIDINGKKVKVAVVSTPKNVKKLLEEIKEDPHAVDYVEVMACPGGCIGGGGQPQILGNKKPEVIEARRSVLYAIDKDKKIRQADKNPLVVEYVEWAEKTGGKELKEKVLYRGY